jgi:positive regulator of sigma E activity
MIEKGTVIRIEGRELWLKSAKSECAGCSGHCSCKGEDLLLHSVNPKNLNLKNGDRVAVSVPPGETKRSSFTMILLPLILFLSAFFASQRLLFLESGLPNLLFGLAGLSFGFGLVILYVRFRWPDGKSIVTKLLEENP